MYKLSPTRLGIAFGISAALFYLACILFMATIPHESVIWIANAVLHGVDVRTVMRESIPLTQSLVGIGITAVGGFLFGCLSACVYNFGWSAHASDSKAA